MNEKILFKTWVIKFCLKVIYPKFNLYTFLVFLAIKSRILWKRKITGLQEMEYYKLKTVPPYIAKMLLNKIDDYVPVVFDRGIIISKEKFVQLCSLNSYYLDNGVLWMGLKLSPFYKKKFHDEDINKSKTSKYNLDFVTSELRKKLWTQNINCIDNIRIVPVVGSNIVQGYTAIVTENQLYNITSCFGLKNEYFEVTFQPVPSVNISPKIAAIAEVNLISNEYDLSNDFIKEVLSNYFEVPKLLSVNDIFNIELTPEITGKYHYKNIEVIERNGKLSFKCKKIFEEMAENDKSLDDNIFRAYFIVKGVTHFSLADNIHTIKAKDEYVKPKRRNLLKNCPAGLKQVFDQMQEAITPFLTNDMNDLSASLSEPIMPLLLLTGSVGSGRHTIVKTLAKVNGLNCLSIDCNTLQSSTAKQTESKISSTIQKSKETAPVIVLLDNFEVFAVDAENNEDCRVIEYFMNCITELYLNYTKHSIIFIAVTEVQDLKPNLLRLFLDKFHIPRLNANQRLEMLEWFAKAMQLKIGDEETPEPQLLEVSTISNNSKEILQRVAAKTEAFSYGNLDTLLHFALKESYLKQHNNYDQLLADPDLKKIEEEDFNSGLEAIRKLQSHQLDAPKIPKVYWEDIGGLEKLKKEILKTIEFPIKYPHLFKNSNLKRSGILMYGPPGCGKTLVAKAVSTELNVSFMSVKGPELLNMYIGQSEENVRKVFESARASSPCIVFLDELDALAPRRGAAGDSGGASDRVVSQLLAELDGVADREDADSTSFVFIMGATNRPDLLEQSLLRPGRLDKMVYVGPYCGLDEKTGVLKALCRNYNIRPEVNLEAIAAALPERCTGADLSQVVTKARSAAVRAVISKLHSGQIKETELSPDAVVLGVSEFVAGMESYRPSVTDEEMAYYESLQSQM